MIVEKTTISQFSKNKLLFLISQHFWPDFSILKFENVIFSNLNPEQILNFSSFNCSFLNSQSQKWPNLTSQKPCPPPVLRMAL